MGVPDHLLIHDIVVVEPAETTDTYGDTDYDYGPTATRRSIKAWLQQDRRTEPRTEGRDPLDQRWLLVTNDDGLTGRSRFEWADHPAGPVVFKLEGPFEPTYSPAGLHHSEATLRILDG